MALLDRPDRSGSLPAPLSPKPSFLLFPRAKVGRRSPRLSAAHGPPRNARRASHSISLIPSRPHPSGWLQSPELPHVFFPFIFFFLSRRGWSRRTRNTSPGLFPKIACRTVSLRPLAGPSFPSYRITLLSPRLPMYRSPHSKERLPLSRLTLKFPGFTVSRRLSRLSIILLADSLLWLFSYTCPREPASTASSRDDVYQLHPRIKGRLPRADPS